MNVRIKLLALGLAMSTWCGHALAAQVAVVQFNGVIDASTYNGVPDALNGLSIDGTLQYDIHSAPADDSGSGEDNRRLTQSGTFDDTASWHLSTDISIDGNPLSDPDFSSASDTMDQSTFNQVWQIDDVDVGGPGSTGPIDAFVYRRWRQAQGTTNIARLNFSLVGTADGTPGFMPFANFALPFSISDFSGIEQGSWIEYFSTAEGLSFDAFFSITDLNVTIVPLPGALFLLTLPLIALGTLRRPNH